MENTTQEISESPGKPSATLARAQSNPPTELRTALGRAQIVHSLEEVDPALWVGDLSQSCMDQRYYELVEKTICAQDFEYRYAILSNEKTGETTVQPFFFVNQDIVAGLPTALRSVVERIREKFPRFLKMRILMVGCTAGEGQLGSSAPWAVEALEQTINAYSKQANVAIILFKDFPATYRETLAPLKTKGYVRVPSMPAAVTELTYKNFDDYMGKKLSRIYRKSLRRKFRDCEQLGGVTMEVTNDVRDYLDEIHPLYLQTHHRSPLKFEELTKGYFSELCRTMPETSRFFIWRHKGKIVAFALCLVHGETIHDLNVGMDYSVALDLHLYFITWRDIVSWAIAEGFKVYYTGPLNYDPKLHLKLKLAPLDLWAKYTLPFINPIFGFAMRYLEPTRYDPVIQKFPNAAEL